MRFFWKHHWRSTTSAVHTRQGDRVKTDKRDALRLAQLFRAGELTSVFFPSEEHESLRDLVRAREDAIEDRLRARHRLSKFLQALQTLRGVAEVVATSLAAEIGEFRRFQHPTKLMAYAGYVLDRYQRNGGRYEEFVVHDAGHSPHIEKPRIVLDKLIEFWEHRE